MRKPYLGCKIGVNSLLFYSNWCTIDLNCSLAPTLQYLLKKVMKCALSNILAIALLFQIAGCGGDDSDVPTLKTDTTLINIIRYTNQTVISPLIDTIFSHDQDTMVALTNKEAFIKGNSRANKRQPAYSVKLLKGQTIIATVRPVDKGGNIRINQIQLPDKSFDGPFGDSLRYTVKKSGTLKFIVGQNMMAGDPWTGEYIFHLKLE